MKTQVNTQRGYSLIELSISLAIIGVVIAGSIIGVQSILRSNNVNKAITQSNIATNKIVAKLARDQDYINANTQNLTSVGMEVWDAANIFSAGTANASVTHSFGSNVWVKNLTAPNFDVLAGQGYVYSLTGVPVSACSDLAIGIESLALSLVIVNETPRTFATALSVLPTTALTGLIKSPGNLFASNVANNACNGPDTGAVQTATISLLIPRR